MAGEKISFLSVLKDTLKGRRLLAKYALFTLVILALSFVSVYLGYTDYSLVGTLIMVVLVLPLIVTFTTYTALVETGGPAPRKFSDFIRLYQTTYRSGQLRLVLTWKVLLGFLLYILITSFVTIFGFSMFIMMFDKPLFNEYIALANSILNTDSPEALNNFVNELLALFLPYEKMYVIINQFWLISGLIYIVNKSVFKVYISMYIEHQPTTSYATLQNLFLNDQITRKNIRRNHTLLLISVLFIYLIFFGGSIFLFDAINPAGLVLLQAELIGLIVLMIMLPIGTVFNFIFFQQVLAPKRQAILIFVIEELKGFYNNENIPEETKDYFLRIIQIRQQELDALRGTPVTDEENGTSHEA